MQDIRPGLDHLHQVSSIYINIIAKRLFYSLRYKDVINLKQSIFINLSGRRPPQWPTDTQNNVIHSSQLPVQLLTVAASPRQSHRDPTTGLP